MGLLCLLTDMAAAADYRVDAQNYRDYLRRLQPGDRVLLAPGDYRQGLPLHNLSGQAGQPIVIEAAGTPLRGSDAAHNLSLDYRPDWLDVAVADLTPRLLAGQPSHRLPDGLARELAVYPGWQGTARPGARVAPAVLNMLDAAQP